MGMFSDEDMAVAEEVMIEIEKRMPKLGTGARFKKLQGQLAAKGVSDPAALAAWIGRKKFGRKRFAALGGKKRKRGGRRYMRKDDFKFIDMMRTDV